LKRGSPASAATNKYSKRTKVTMNKPYIMPVMRESLPTTRKNDQKSAKGTRISSATTPPWNIILNQIEKIYFTKYFDFPN